jgi:alkylhydroperoxidase family enzyme
MTEEGKLDGFFVPPVPVNQAQGRLAEIYRDIAGNRGGVANILTCAGLNPPSVSAHMALYKAVMFGSSPLSRAQREMVAVAVSRANACHY